MTERIYIFEYNTNNVTIERDKHGIVVRVNTDSLEQLNPTIIKEALEKYNSYLQSLEEKLRKELGALITLSIDIEVEPDELIFWLPAKLPTITDILKIKEVLEVWQEHKDIIEEAEKTLKELFTIAPEGLDPRRSYKESVFTPFGTVRLLATHYPNNKEIIYEEIIYGSMVENITFPPHLLFTEKAAVEEIIADINKEFERRFRSLKWRVEDEVFKGKYQTNEQEFTREFKRRLELLRELFDL